MGRIDHAVGDGVDVAAPLVLGLRRRFDAIQALLANRADCISDPVDVLLNRGDHLRLHAGAARAGDHEHVGKACDH